MTAESMSDPHPPEDDDEGHFDDPDFDDEDEDEGWDECGMMPGGQCSLAGTEWCDWDCPRNRR